MKSYFKNVKSVVLSIILFVVSAITFALSGGSFDQKITGKDGCEYQVKAQLNAGIPELVANCKLKDVGNTCVVASDIEVKKLSCPAEAEPAPESK
jgi:hypothetical protein